MYRVYVTDSLKLQGENKILSKRYYDLIRPAEQIPEQSAEEIVIATLKKIKE